MYDNFNIHYNEFGNSFEIEYCTLLIWHQSISVSRWFLMTNITLLLFHYHYYYNN